MNIQQEREEARARHTAVLNSPEATGTPKSNRDLAAATGFVRELNAHAALTIGGDWSRSGRELAKQYPCPWEFAAVRTGIAFERPARFDRLPNPHIVVAGFVIAGFLTVSDAGMVWQLVSDVDEFKGRSVTCFIVAHQGFKYGRYQGLPRVVASCEGTTDDEAGEAARALRDRKFANPAPHRSDPTYTVFTEAELRQHHIAGCPR